MNVRRILLTFAVLLAPYFAVSQTTYTVVQNSCGAKNLGYCMMNVTDQNGNPYTIAVDHRSNSQGPIDKLTIETPVYPYSILYEDHGTFSGFVSIPPSHDDQFGTITIDTDDGQVHAELNYQAHYVWTCAGRACAGASIGWHYIVFSGSTIVKQ